MNTSNRTGTYSRISDASGRHFVQPVAMLVVILFILSGCGESTLPTDSDAGTTTNGTADGSEKTDSQGSDYDANGDLQSVDDAHVPDAGATDAAATDAGTGIDNTPPPPCTPTTKPVEVCDGLDNDCDGATDNVACADDNPCTIGVCLGYQGCQFKPQAVTCDDGDSCTKSDFCVAGQCGGKQVGCGDGNTCTDDSCNPKMGCVHKTNTALCSDGDACTQADHCTAKGCVASKVVCDDGNPCTLDTCDSLLGCNTKPRQGSCDDGDSCTSDDTCSGGVCGGKVSCDDGNPCTIDGCLAGAGCVFLPTPATCTDGDPCTGSDTCTGGACVGAPISCDDNKPCTDDTCVSAKGGCQYKKRVCNDNKVCTFDACIPAKGCMFVTLNGQACTDGSACVTTGTCSGDTCAMATAICDDGNSCTTDYCAGSLGCKHISLTGAVCDDGNVCTIKDGCKAGKCVAIVDTCNDKEVCTADSCDAKIGCVHKQLTSACDDGNPCTIGDVCKAGTCARGEAVMVSTLAGRAAIGDSDGVGAKAGFWGNIRLAADRKGGVVVAEIEADRIRYMTEAGKVTTVTGFKQKPTGTDMLQDGPVATATFDGMNDVTVDGDGIIYVVERGSVRKVVMGGNVTTIIGTLNRFDTGRVDGYGAVARLNYGRRLTYDRHTNALFITDTSDGFRTATLQGHLRSFTPAFFGQPWYSTFRNGIQPHVLISRPGGTTQVLIGKRLAAMDEGRRLTEILSFNSVGGKGLLTGPVGQVMLPDNADMSVLPDGSLVYAGLKSSVIYRLHEGMVTVLAGSTFGFQDGPANTAHFSKIHDLTVTSRGDIIVADDSVRMRRIRISRDACSINGSCWSAGVRKPGQSCLHCDNAIKSTGWTPRFDTTDCDDGNPCTREMTCQQGKCSASTSPIAPFVATLRTLVQTAKTPACRFIDGKSIVQTRPFTSQTVGSNGKIYWLSVLGDNILYLATNGSPALLKTKQCDPWSKKWRSDCLLRPTNLLAHPKLGLIALDYSGRVIRQIAFDGTVSTLAGHQDAGFVNGVGAKTRFKAIRFMEIGADGLIYAADSQNKAVRVITTDGEVSTWLVNAKGVTPEVATKMSSFGVDVHGSLIGLSFEKILRRVTAAGAAKVLFDYSNPGLVDGPVATAQIAGISSIYVMPDGGLLLGGVYGLRLLYKGQVTTIKPRLIGGTTPLGEVDSISHWRDNLYLLSSGRDCRITVLELSGNSCLSRSACVPAGQPDIGQPCVTCQPSKSRIGFTPMAKGQACEDGVLCTSEDVCDAQLNCKGSPMNCDDNDPNTADLCSTKSGGCVHIVN